MNDFSHHVYRLFAPFVVVFLIIMGVDLSSGLIKNAQETQTAISIAHAQACEGGTSPAVPNKAPPDPKGGYQIIPCMATTPAGPVPGMTVQGTGCCKANGGQMQAKDAMKGLMDALKDLLKPKPKSPQTPEEEKAKPPICKSVIVSPTLPLRPGESATLSWTLEGGKADSVIVTPGAGAVQGLSMRVTPRISTTYTVVAKSEAGNSTCPKVRVYVGVADDTTDSESNNSNNNGNGTVDIFNGNNGDTNNGTSESYDDIWNGTNNASNEGSVRDYQGQQTAGDSELENEDNDYYDFLSSLADDAKKADTVEQNNTDTDIYYGGAGDLGNFEGVDPNWDNLDLQEGEVGQTDSDSLALGARNEPYQDSDYIYTEPTDRYEAPYGTGNGLTDKEIYGVWNRPQSPATGGLGLSGGYSGSGGFGGGSSSNVPIIDFGEPSQEKKGGIWNWLKNTFCFWCKV